MGVFPLVAASLYFLALHGKAAQTTAGRADRLFDVFWTFTAGEGCDTYPVSAVVATYADGEELFNYGIYNKIVGFGYNTGPKLEYLQNRTTFRNGEWCAQTDTTPRYIDSNSAQKFEVGQKLENPSTGIFKTDIYFKVFDKNTKPTSNCILKMSLASGVPSSLTKGTGCKAYPKLQILNYHRATVVDKTNINLDGNMFWVYWDDAKIARPTGIDSDAFDTAAAAAPSATAPLKPAPIKSETGSTSPDSSSLGQTSTDNQTSSAAAHVLFRESGCHTLLLLASLVAAAIGIDVV